MCPHIYYVYLTLHELHIEHTSPASLPAGKYICPCKALEQPIRTIAFQTDIHTIKCIQSKIQLHCAQKLDYQIAI